MCVLIFSTFFFFFFLILRGTELDLFLKMCINIRVICYSRQILVKF
jgi:hypothetical protein